MLETVEGNASRSYFGTQGTPVAAEGSLEMAGGDPPADGDGDGAPREGARCRGKPKPQARRRVQ